MPNWCHNKLTVSGEQETVEAFIRKVQVTPDDVVGDPERRVTPLTFTAHVPMPVLPPEEMWF